MQDKKVNVLKITEEYYEKKIDKNILLFVKWVCVPICYEIFFWYNINSFTIYFVTIKQATVRWSKINVLWHIHF